MHWWNLVILAQGELQLGQMSVDEIVDMARERKWREGKKEGE